MYCKNCGAEYEEQLTECPYCGAENYKKSVEEHRKVLDDYRKKMRAISYIAGRKGVKAVGILLIAIVVIMIVGSFIAGKV